MTKNNVKVSVLMSVYNGEKYLAESIDCILSQTFSDYEFIIINDGSTDQTQAILEQYQQVDDRLIIINQENQGLTRSLNNGLKLARGEYVGRMDVGDISLPERLERQVQWLEQHSDVGLIGCSFCYIDEVGNLSAPIERPSEHGSLKWLLCFYNPIPNALAMLRRSAIEQVDGFDSNYRFSQDYDLWARLSAITKLANLPEVLFWVRKAGSEDISRKYVTAQRQLSTATSQRMISALIGKTIQLELVEAVKYEKYLNITQRRQSAELVWSLYQAFKRANQLANTEEHQVQADVARRLWHIARPVANLPVFWPILARAYWLQPEYLLNKLFAPFRHLQSTKP